MIKWYSLQKKLNTMERIYEIVLKALKSYGVE